MSETAVRQVACACGQVRFAASGLPIQSAICFCDDCQAGAKQIGALPGARKVAREDGGTPYALFRRDRFRCEAGADRLQDLRLTDGAPSKRVVAACCNTGLYLDFEKGHWVSVYHGGLTPPAPALAIAIQTRFRRPDAPPLELPASKAFPLSFVGKILMARIAMAFGR